MTKEITNKNAQNSVNKNIQITDELDFILQKFLIRTNLIEEEQKILGQHLEEFNRQLKLKKVYQYIISKH